MRHLLLLPMLLLGSCARNAIFDLDVVIPSQSAPSGMNVYAYIEIADGVSDFDQDPFAIAGVESVLVGEATTVPFSIVTSDPTLEVRVRVRYCYQSDLTMVSDCSGGGDANDLTLHPGHRYSIPRAFYIGHVTTHTIRVPPATAAESTTVTVVPRCLVGGCIPVSEGVSSCRDTTDIFNETQPHFCE